jgi:Na+/H+-dicarboxylate symporter
MNKILKNYLFTILLLLGLIIGGVCGVIFRDGVSVVKPIGDIFLNLMFVLVVPLVFLSIASAMYKMKENHLIGKVLGWTVVVFLGMSLIAGVMAYAGAMWWYPFGSIDSGVVALNADAGRSHDTGELIVNTLTVSDFSLLLSKNNLLPLIIIAAIFGLATAYIGEKGRPVAEFTESCLEVIMKMMGLIMYLAPIGLGCYFANQIGELGSQILGSYLGLFLLLVVLVLLIFFILHPIYILIFCGRRALRKYWRHILTPSLTAIATCSSAACMPVNISAVEKMGCEKAIAESVVPLGTNLHKDGSVITSVFKFLFALIFFGQFTGGLGQATTIILLSVVVSIVVGAVPVGGMTAEILVCSILGLDPTFAATLLIIGTISDIPATLLNSNANVVAAFVVDGIIKKGQSNERGLKDKKRENDKKGQNYEQGRNHQEMAEHKEVPEHQEMTQ